MMTAPTTTTQHEATLAFPAGRIVAAMLVAAALVGSIWVGVTLALKMDANVQASGLAGAGVVAVIAVLGVLAMAPWKARPVSMWMTLWLAGTLVRMLVTPAATFVLYSAAPLNAVALTLAVAATYLIVLLTETAVIARSVGRAAPPH